MAFVLVAVGLLMVITGFKGTYQQFGAQVTSDFTGSQPFTYWLAAIGAIGLVGYVDALRTFSRLFMALILMAMILANKGFFAKFTAALKAGPTAPSGGTGSPGAPAQSGSGGATSSLGLFGQSPGAPGAVGTSGQSTFNKLMNGIFGTGG